MLDRLRHEQILKSILRDIYTNINLQAAVAFKGGSCLYLFYGLNRFSVDLDFNLRTDKFDPKILDNIVTKHLTINDHANKHNTWFWIGSYEKSFQKVKIEVSKRNYPDNYINMDFYGLSLPTMEPSCMLAHKLCAIIDRPKLQNRDIFDAHFMFSKDFLINEEIIKIRTGKSVKEYILELIEFIEKEVNSSNILNGLGELLSGQQKDSLRATLKRDILFDLKSRIV